MRVEQRAVAPLSIFSGHPAVPGAQHASTPASDTLPGRDGQSGLDGRPGLDGRLGLDGRPGLGGSALARAVERWRRALLHDHASPAPSGPPQAPASASGSAVSGSSASSAADPDALAALARRLDDSGCSYGRVSAARLDGVIRASDRMETKLNAVLMAVTGTFLSTLAGLLLYYVRGGGQ